MKTQKILTILFSIITAGIICSVNSLAASKLVVDVNAPLTIPNKVYKDINSAIGSVDNGGTIIVRPGTYVGTSNNNISFASKNIRLVSSHGADATIIDCQNTVRRGIVINGAQNRSTLVEGFTIQN